MKLRDYLDHQHEQMTDIKVAIKGIQKDIGYHVKRTNLLEEKVNLIRKQVKPLETQATIVKTVCKGIASLIFVAGAAAGIYKIFFL